MSLKEIFESLSPLERKILPFINQSLNKIEKETGLDKTSVLRALRFLENKKILNLKSTKKSIVELGVNGVYYKKNHLPERTLLSVIEKNPYLELAKAKSLSSLSDNELKASIGVLKRKALIELTNNKLILKASKEEITKKFPEEHFLESLPKEFSSLSPEEKYAFNNLKQRKDIIEIVEKTELHKTLTPLGLELSSKKYSGMENLAEEVTQDMIKTGSSPQFRRYDIQAPVPHISGGKRHFVNQAIEYARKIWLELGFKEMTGPHIDSAFWIFDALFTPQDHPVREMQDTFYIKDQEAEFPSSKIVESVQKAHQSGIANSKGWAYQWEEKEAKRVCLRTHTTSLSARTLANINPNIPAKFFTIGKAFRNETIDWSHGIEFYQTEGIVVDKDVTLRHLFGYLHEFYKKMGFTKIRFRPSYFPYTEPSVEIDIYHPEKKQWLELGGAGILRPEVTTPLLGKPVPVLAWGQGLDRIIMDAYKIKDLREMYSNNLKSLRSKKTWLK